MDTISDTVSLSPSSHATVVKLNLIYSHWYSTLFFIRTSAILMWLNVLIFWRFFQHQNALIFLFSIKYSYLLIAKIAIKYKAITFGGASFSTNVARRKTVVQPECLGRRCKPFSVGSRGETLEILGYFAFWIAQNIALLALQQGTLTKAYTRNQHFWAFGGVSLSS